jgi:mono/diheme cytochrome c family protein
MMAKHLPRAVETAREAMQMSARLVLPVLLLTTFLATAASAADRSAQGKAILQEHCARCHAIEAAGASPFKSAPPMRDIYGRYATRELQQELSEGLVSKHKAMPQISFSDEDVAAILAYLYDLARGK